MKRTKPSAKSTKLPSGSKNIGTQTENIDSLLEVAKLEEQVRVLQLENNVLRKHVGSSNKSDYVVRGQRPLPLTPRATATATINYVVRGQRPLPLTPRATATATIKSPVEKSGCSCKGSCSSRICGCVKKSNKCAPPCKCDIKICQNQKPRDQENKENVNRTDMETPKKQKEENEAVGRIKNNRGLFSPEMRELYKDHLEEGQFSDICFTPKEKNTRAKNSQTNVENINNVELKKKRREKKEENDKKQPESTEKVIFNPMKPRHVLSRTPPNGKKLEKSLEVENTIQPQLHSEPAQKVVEDIKEGEVDWEEHTAQLIPCKKCKRTFLPNRIQKHEACCKKV
ncbi:uncharacterized protein LOC112468880 [Temnothorax curvispinosus]|uniref:Uncharacterized protein LOC112468880 n=1 Tax=Temnothorax curvispinosus TaxID=300111 RepID=A0A6J1RMU8_9HYME|nr:uncharacterized protein LOC112468880 [Temnothorax curvispinosus]